VNNALARQFLDRVSAQGDASQSARHRWLFALVNTLTALRSTICTWGCILHWVKYAANSKVPSDVVGCHLSDASNVEVRMM
jgi:hypothetical protein